MSVREIAREWLQRPIVILVCGRGEYVTLLADEFVEFVHARGRTELDARLRHPSIDVAIVEDAPWPGEDAISLSRAVRSRGIGTIFAARTAESAERLLRERMTVDLSAIDLAQHLENALWLAVCESELLKRDLPELRKRIASNTAAPLFMRYVEGDQGQLAPSQSTMMYIFDDAPRVSVAEGRAPLVAPALPLPPEAVARPDAEDRSTVRQKRDRTGPLMPWWLWALFGLGAVALILLLLVLLRP
jgi:hypothetical protein